MSPQSMELFKEMSLDKFKSQMLVQDDVCMGGLVMVLSNDDPCVVHAALETLQRLVGWTDLQSSIREFIGVHDQLDSLRCSEISRPDVRELATELYVTLYGAADRLCVSAADRFYGAADRLLDESHSVKNDLSSGIREKKKRRNSFFVESVSKARTIVLEIRGFVDKVDEDTCRNHLLTVKGVISITFEFKKKRAIVRIKPQLQPRVLAEAIARSETMVANQVIKNKYGSEELVSFEDEVPNKTDLGGDVIMPEYPVFEDDIPPPGEMDVARPDMFTSVAEGSWRVIRTVGSFLTHSFYW